MNRATTRFIATVIGGVGLAAAAGTGLAAAEPGPDGGQTIVINGQQRPDIARIVLRDDIPGSIPGYDMNTLPGGCPGVIVMKDGSTQQIPPGAVLHRN